MAGWFSWHLCELSSPFRNLPNSPFLSPTFSILKTNWNTLWPACSPNLGPAPCPLQKVVGYKLVSYIFLKKQTEQCLVWNVFKEKRPTLQECKWTERKQYCFRRTCKGFVHQLIQRTFIPFARSDSENLGKRHILFLLMEMGGTALYWALLSISQPRGSPEGSLRRPQKVGKSKVLQAKHRGHNPPSPTLTPSPR